MTSTMAPGWHVGVAYQPLSRSPFFPSTALAQTWKPNQVSALIHKPQFSENSGLRPVKHWHHGFSCLYRFSFKESVLEKMWQNRGEICDWRPGAGGLPGDCRWTRCSVSVLRWDSDALSGERHGPTSRQQLGSWNNRGVQCGSCWTSAQAHAKGRHEKGCVWRSLRTQRPIWWY